MTAFTVDDLLDCYRRGVFPMADDRDSPLFHLVDPPSRGVIPLGALHVPARLARTIRQRPYEIRIDSAFDQIVGLCAEPAQGRPETWISRDIQSFYLELFRRGQAHSVECWLDGELVGGLYGIALHAAFFGESMVSRRTDASKIALVHLCARLIRGGFTLLDTQMVNQHLTQFGVQEISRNEYHLNLGRALGAQADFMAYGERCDQDDLQVISQAS